IGTEGGRRAVRQTTQRRVLPGAACGPGPVAPSVERVALLEFGAQRLERGLAVHADLAGRREPLPIQRLGRVAPGFLLFGRELDDRVAGHLLELGLAGVLVVAPGRADFRGPLVVA